MQVHETTMTRLGVPTAMVLVTADPWRARRTTTTGDRGLHQSAAVLPWLAQGSSLPRAHPTEAMNGQHRNGGRPWQATWWRIHVPHRQSGLMVARQYEARGASRIALVCGGLAMAGPAKRFARISSPPRPRTVRTEERRVGKEC